MQHDAIHDVDRPDVDGKAPLMLPIVGQATERLAGLAPVLRIKTDDNIMSSVDVVGSLDARETWINGIFENSRYFRFSITPMGGRRYYNPDDPKVTVELDSYGHQIKARFRKYTAAPERGIEKIAEWIGKAAAE